jgi:putative FmdB family regulatory protein
MPLYEYECKDHGVFEDQRSMSDFDAPGVCPTCRGESSRVVSAPSLRLTRPSERIARDRNEQSRHQPRVVTREQGPSSSGAPLRASAGGHPWALGHS